MIDINKLTLVNYCHPDCVPMKNIMRLPEKEAYALAKKLSDSHKDTTAFYRFADFENYYPTRCKQDQFLYEAFISKGGKPEEKHPLSFVIDGSDYLKDWFSDGIETRIPLKEINPEDISFTIGDSGAMQERDIKYDILTLDELKERMEGFETFTDFLKSTGRGYVEVQLWTDRYLSM